MAGEISPAILSALSQIMAPDLYRQWNRTTYLLGALTASAGMGKNAAFDVEFTGATAQTVAEGADVPASEFNSDVNVPMIMPWCTYRSSFQISEQEIDIARTSVGTADALRDLLGDRILGAGAKLALQLETDALTGTGVDANGNPALTGIFGGAISATGTYGGINPATYSEWAANVSGNNGTPRALTTDLLGQVDANIFNAAAVPWNLLMTTAGVARKYENVFTYGMGNSGSVNAGGGLPVVRINDGNAYALGRPNDQQMQIAQLFYKGLPVYRNPFAPTGKLAYLNTDLIKFKYLPHSPTRNELEFFGNLGLQGSSGIGAPGAPIQATGMQARMVELGKTGDSHKISLRITCAMAIVRRNAMGLLVDLQET